ncbi:MAG: hypothetical protein LCH38_10860 [Proteobacteria bacterium]|nr:hypothetical protein [Pseudomonadota bacterium]
MAVDGKSDEAIAEALELSLPTLRKYFAETLSAARAECAPTLFESAPLQSGPAPPRPRGRKRYVPMNADRERVRILKATGIAEAIIAARLGVSEPTLRRAFRADLDHARETARAEIIETLHRQARGGSTAAAKALKEMLDEIDLASIAARRAAPAGEARASEKETLGKKVQQAKAAEKAGRSGKWAKLSQEMLQ